MAEPIEPPETKMQKLVAKGKDLTKILAYSNNATKVLQQRFKTDSDRRDFAIEVKAVLKKHPRHKSFKDRSLITGLEYLDSPLTFAQSHFRQILSGLESRNLQTSRIMLKNFPWLFARPDSTAEELVTYELVQRCPIAVENGELATILHLKEQRWNSTPTEPGKDYVYIRSFEFSGRELAQVIYHMRQNGDKFVELKEWQAVLEVFQWKNDQIFTIRYAGVVQGPKRPLDRYDKDLARSHGVFGAFVHTLLSHFPQIERDAQVHMLVDATVTSASLAEIPTASIEDNERMVIEFLGPTTLLNRQRGGFYVSYVPLISEMDTFREVKTDLWQRFRDMAGLPDNTTISSLSEHFQIKQDFANGNPDSTGTEQRPFTDTHREMVCKQATPFQYRNATVIVFLGKDVTMGEYISETRYIDGGSQAGYLTRDFISRLVKQEARAHGRDWDFNSFDPHLGYFTFLDFWPWLRHKDRAKATELLQDYLGITQPLLVVTFGAQTNAITRANFLNDHGVPINKFTQLVAIPSIQFSSVDVNGVGDPDSAFINLPHIHHGSDKYGVQDVTLRRLLDLSLQFTHLIGHTALDILDKYPNVKSRPNRQRLCEEILAEVERLCTQSRPHINFARALEDARSGLLQHWAEVQALGVGKKRSNLSKLVAEKTGRNKPGAKSGTKKVKFVDSRDVVVDDLDDDRPQLTDQEACSRVASLGVAEGAPGSFARGRQLDALWSANHPDLHIHIPHNPYNKQEWITSLDVVPEGHLFYFHLLALKDPGEFVHDLLDEFKPTSVDPNRTDWLKDQKLRRTAIDQASSYVLRELASNEQIERVGQRAPDKFLSPADCQGRPLRVDLKGNFTIKWLNANTGGRLNTTATCGPAAVTQIGQRRYLYFNEFGIDIVGGRQQVLRAILAGGKLKNVSIELISFQNRPELFELWTQVCKAHGIDTSNAGKPAKEAKDWPGRAGVGMLSSTAKEEKPVQNRPPKPEDANYPLVQFINSRPGLANGGKFRTVSKDIFPDSSEDLAAFVEFLRSPEYINHHYSAEWLKFLGVAQPRIHVLSNNLPIYRYCTTVQRRVAVQSKNERYFVLGAPGSALSDPFAPGSKQSCHADAKTNEGAAKALKEWAKTQGDQSAASAPAPKPKRQIKQLEDDDDIGMQEPARGFAGDEEEEEEVPKPKSRKKRGKKKAVEVLEEDGDEEQVVEEAPHFDPKLRKRSRAPEEDGEEEYEAPSRKKRVLKKPSTMEDTTMTENLAPGYVQPGMMQPRKRKSKKT